MNKGKKSLQDENGFGLFLFLKRCNREECEKAFRNTWFAEISLALFDQDFNRVKDATESIVTQFKDECDWLAPVIGLYTIKLRLLAGGDLHRLRVTKELLDSTFRSSTSMGRKGLAESSPILPLLLVTQQMKIFAKLKTDALTRNLMRTVDNPNFPPIDSFSVARRVAYCFYAGRIYVLEDDPSSALNFLEFAYLASDQQVPIKNHKRALEYLTAVRLALGFQPKKSVLTEIQRDFPVLYSIIKAIARGASKDVMNLLNANQKYLCQRGIFTILTRCRFFAARNLLKILINLHRETCEASERNKIPLAKFYKTFEQYDDYDPRDDLVAQTKCVIANLIAMSLVKGYLNYEREVLVVSANEAFPKTSLALFF